MSKAVHTVTRRRSGGTLGAVGETYNHELSLGGKGTYFVATRIGYENDAKRGTAGRRTDVTALNKFLRKYGFKFGSVYDGARGSTQRIWRVKGRGLVGLSDAEAKEAMKLLEQWKVKYRPH